MVSFRRCILALTVLVLFAGLASAQVIATPMSCQINVSTTETVRSEGYTEQTGDIVVTCTGGSTLPAGSQIPAVNITIALNTQVTSRLLPMSGGAANASEALILIDEPGSGLPGYGPSLPQKVCATPATGCTQYVGSSGSVLGNAADACTSTNAFGACVSTSTVFGANVQQGLVTGNQVTFFGIPVLAPVTAGSSRVFRITNIRANATALGGGSAAGPTPIIASVLVSQPSVLPISNPTPTVGFIQQGLVATASGATNNNQCNSNTRGSVNILTFTEGFGSAFKTRIQAQSNTLYAGQGVPSAASPGNQNVPGVIYNSESNFVLGGMAANSGTAGLTEYGTRLKASFSNIPAGIRLFVSVTNVNNAAIAVSAPAVVGGSAANTGTTGYAQMVISETTSDGTGAGSGFFPSVTATDVPSSTAGNTPIVEIPVVNGAATAVWEVINTNPNAIEGLKFGVYSTYTSNVAQNSPPPGTGTVNLSFAPTPTAPFSAAAGAAASSTLTIPRFIADTGAARNIFNINICRTILLYPYVTNIQGFDTGIAISNTSTDPFGTGPQAGSCKLNWYQGANNPAVIDTGSIASGTVYTTLASTAVPGFNGYMIAVCSFQYAHGFAFISDLGARNLAMGYLALVIVDPSTQSGGVRNASPLGASNVTINGGGENIGH